jgi:integrase
MTTWTAEQLRTFLTALPADRFYAPLFLLATTGMRLGEALGLQWADIRLDDAELDVRRTLGLIAGRIVVGEPKTRSGLRTVSLDPATVEVLRAHRKTQLAERLARGAASGDGDWVFTQAGGGTLHPTRFRRAFHRRTADAGVPKLRVHDLRHTWATLALRAGVNPKIVQERIGHASVAITLDLYTHTDRDLHAQAARAVSDLFVPTQQDGALAVR